MGNAHKCHSRTQMRFGPRQQFASHGCPRQPRNLCLRSPFPGNVTLNSGRQEAAQGLAPEGDDGSGHLTPGAFSNLDITSGTVLLGLARFSDLLPAREGSPGCGQGSRGTFRVRELHGWTLPWPPLCPLYYSVTQKQEIAFITVF